MYFFYLGFFHIVKLKIKNILMQFYWIETHGYAHNMLYIVILKTFLQINLYLIYKLGDELFFLSKFVF